MEDRGILFRTIPNTLRSCLGCFQSETADRLAEPALTFWVASAFRQGCCAPMCLRQGECVGKPLCHCQCPHHSGYVLSVCDEGGWGGGVCVLRLDFHKVIPFQKYCGCGWHVFVTTLVFVCTPQDVAYYLRDQWTPEWWQVIKLVEHLKTHLIVFLFLPFPLLALPKVAAPWTILLTFLMKWTTTGSDTALITLLHGHKVIYCFQVTSSDFPSDGDS